MRDCIVLGSGRSGTSLATGILADAGYFTGANHWPPTDANPRGFFEDRTVNDINEKLLAPHTPRTLPWMFGHYVPGRLGWLQRWLAVIPIDARIEADKSTDRRIAKATERRPLCLKDPRFCYTLPAWRPHLVDPVFLCVFRHPAVTLTSLRREISTAPSLRNVSLDDDHLVELWCSMYRHVLELHQKEGEWLFAHYDQVFSGECFDEWNQVLGVDLDRDFADHSLRRSAPSTVPIPESALAIYDTLSRAAGYRPEDAP